MTDTIQKLCEACNYIDALGGDSRSYRQALALPTADHIPDSGEMVADHLPNAGKMINGLTKSETDASASVSGLTAAPVGERELFEKELARLFGYSPHAFGKDRNGDYAERHIDEFYMVWQARAALSAGDAVDAQMYRWLMDNCTLGIKQNGVGWSLNTTACIAPDCIKDVGATIDAAMRKGQP